MPCRLHLRGRADALHPPRRVRRLWRLRAGLSGRGHLLRGRCARPVEGLLHRQRGVLLRARLARRSLQAGQDRKRPPTGRRAAAARRVRRAIQLPDFPWDRLEPYKTVAAAHPDGLVDLSVGTPVDPTPAVVKRALAAAADAPGYPLTAG